MAATNELQSVSFTPSNFIRDPKFLRSRACMVAAGFVIPKGTVLGLASSGAYSGFYIPYASGNSDGSQVPVGFLAYDVDTTSSGVNRNYDTVMYTSGDFYYSYLTALNLDSNAITLMHGRVIASDNSIQF